MGVDVLHKLNWIRLVSRMFGAMAENFDQAEDIQGHQKQEVPFHIVKTKFQSKSRKAFCIE